MVDVSTETIIARPLAVVAAYAADPMHATVWYKNIKVARWVQGDKVQVGNAIAFEAHFLGKKMAYTYRISDYVVGQRLVMETADGPFPMQTTYTWQAVDAGHTRMTLRNAGSPSGFSRWVAPFMAWAMRRANTQDLVLLRQVLEQQ